MLDDFELEASSVRMQAADMILALGDEADTELRLLRLDLLRRSMAFKETMAEADHLLKEQSEPRFKQIAVAQRRAAFE